jgi:DNA-binding IscR family transcriptional regulator
MLAPIGCASRNFFRACDDCDKKKPCGVRLVMAQARDAIASVLDARTLVDLRELGGDDTPPR